MEAIKKPVDPKHGRSFTERLLDVLMLGRDDPRSLTIISLVTGTIFLALFMVGIDLWRERSFLLGNLGIERNVYQKANDPLTRWLTWAPHPLLETMPEIPAGISGEFVLRPSGEGADSGWIMQSTSRFPVAQLSMFPTGTENGTTIFSSGFECKAITRNLRKAISANGLDYWFMPSPFRIFYSADSGKTCSLVASTTPKVEAFSGGKHRPQILGEMQEFEFLNIELSSRYFVDDSEVIGAIVIDEHFDIANLPSLTNNEKHIVFAAANEDGSTIYKSRSDKLDTTDVGIAIDKNESISKQGILYIPRVSGNDTLVLHDGIIQDDLNSRVITLKQLPAYRGALVGDTIAPTLAPNARNSTTNSDASRQPGNNDASQAQQAFQQPAQSPLYQSIIENWVLSGTKKDFLSPEEQLRTVLQITGLETLDDVQFAALILSPPKDDTFSFGNLFFLSQGLMTTITRRFNDDVLSEETTITLPDTWLRDVSVSRDGSQIWLSITPKDMIGQVHRPTVYFSNNAGETFSILSERETPPHLIWFVFALSGPFLLVSSGAAMRARQLKLKDPDDPTRSAESVLDDSPIGLAGKDVLGLRRLALGIANVIHNTGTSPPLTFGITGSWGSGKSSLMTMLKEDLQSRSGRVIWFNGWHHQSEDHALAAILEAIRSKAVPPIWTGSGLLFRTRLLWQRRRLATNFLFPYFAILAGFWVIYHASGLSLEINGWTEKLTGVDSVISPLTALSVPALVAFWRIAKPFKFSPMNLLERTTALTSIVSLEDKLSVRYNFRAQFADVTQVLSDMGTDLTIIIDDLDRCTPEHVRMILDAINFLTSAGPCYIVLGFDKARVLELLERQYKEETDEEDIAARYIQKIINVELAVPEFNENMADAMIDAIANGDGEHQNDAPAFADETSYLEKFEERKKRLRFSNAFDRLLGFVFIAIVAGVLSWLVIGAAITWRTVDETGEETTQNESAVGEQVAASTAPTAVETPIADSAPPAVAPVNGQSDAVSEEPEAPIRLELHPPLPQKVTPLAPGSSLLNLIFAGAILSLSVLLFLFDFFRQLQRRLDSTTDSDDLKNALKEWIPYIQANEPTPRNLKQFVNYTRLVKECLPQSTGTTLSDEKIVACSAIKRLLDDTALESSNGSGSDEDPFAELKQKHEDQKFQNLISSIEPKDWRTFSRLI